MNERFTTCGINKDEVIIRDKFNKCPLQDIPLPTVKGNLIKDWLNENVEDYKRFKVEEYVNCNGIHCFNLWDNEAETYIRFRPVCESNNPKFELEDYVNWLNMLWEYRDD